MTENPCFPFIIGRGRSGTTLIRSMLTSHPLMAIPYESHFPVTMSLVRDRYEHEGAFGIVRFLTDLRDHWAFKRWGLPHEKVVAAFRSSPPRDLPEAIRVVYRTYAEHHGKHRYGEKTPGFVVHIPLLAQLFPESRFIHVIRDGRNVALSYLEGGWGPKTVAEAATYWKRFVRRGRTDGRKLGPDRYLEVRYEDLLEDPEAKLRTMCAFVELEYDDAMLRYFERDDFPSLRFPTHLVKGHRNLKRPPTKGLRDWSAEMSKHDVAIFATLAGDLLAELGYEPAAEGVSRGDRVRAYRGWASAHLRRAARRTGKQIRLRARSRPWSTAPETR